MLSVSEIVAKTEAMFDLFNHHFYNDELTRPAITVSPDGGRGAYGWTITMLTEETAAWLAHQPGMEDITASRKTVLQIKTKADDDNGGETTTTIKGGRSTSKNRSIKYVCPHCGAIIRATRQVNVVCGDCDVPFEQA